MGCAKTASVILSAVLATIAAWLLGYFCFPGLGYLFQYLDPKIQEFVQLAAVLIMAAAYGITVYLLLIWNSGGKLAALGVLFFGLFGELLFLIVLHNIAVFHEIFLWNMMLSSTSHLFNGLNIAFGVAGFFTKRRTG